MFQAIKWLKFQGSDVPPGYEEAFHRAVLTFKHQRVFDPVSQRMVFLTEPYGNDIPDKMDFVGPPLSAEVACGIAEGHLCPVSCAPFEVGPEGLLSYQLVASLSFFVRSTTFPVRCHTPNH